MHEFKHGELESCPNGNAGKVKSAKQALAIALSEAGVFKRKTPGQNAKSETTHQVQEGKTAADRTRAELYEAAKRRDMPGRSKMSKAHLEKALS